MDPPQMQSYLQMGSLSSTSSRATGDSSTRALARFESCTAGAGAGIGDAATKADRQDKARAIMSLDCIFVWILYCRYNPNSSDVDVMKRDLVVRKLQEVAKDNSL